MVRGWECLAGPGMWGSGLGLLVLWRKARLGVNPSLSGRDNGGYY